MKKANIIILVLIAAAIGIIISTFGDLSTYETFSSAAQKPGTSFHVVGFLDSSKQQQYDPLTDPNLFTFYAKDKKGSIHQVIFSGPKPQDFERSEQLVMTGFMQGDDFHCSKILMKCPSKYEEDQIAIGSSPQAASM